MEGSNVVSGWFDGSFFSRSGMWFRIGKLKGRVDVVWRYERLEVSLGVLVSSDNRFWW